MKSAFIQNTFNRKGQLSQLALDNGLSNLEMCMAYLRKLPYGRNTHRDDLRLVFTEKKGTCSSKHAALKSIAIEQAISEVRFILCIYKMNVQNTSRIGPQIGTLDLNIFLRRIATLILMEKKSILLLLMFLLLA